MRTFTPKPNQSQKPASSSLVRPNIIASKPNHDPYAMPHSQHTLSDQAVGQDNAEEFTRGSTPTTSSRFAHDFSRVPVHSKTSAQIQPKLTVSTPGDRYEQEADWVAEQVMRMPEPQLQQGCACGVEYPKCQRKETSISQELSKYPETNTIPRSSLIREILWSPGDALELSIRAPLEEDLNRDFSQVRVHRDSRAAETSSAINAKAFTVGNHVVFGRGEYTPHTDSGRKLLVHELVHTIQQRAFRNRKAMIQHQAGHQPPVVQQQAPAPPDLTRVEWDAHPRIQGHFADGLQTYRQLRPLYQARGIQNPAQYLDQNIVTVRFFGHATPAH